MFKLCFTSMKKTRLLSFKTSPLSWKVYETMAKNKMSMGILHCNSATWKYENVKKNCVQGISRTNRWIKDVKIFSIRYCRHVNFSGLKRNINYRMSMRKSGIFYLMSSSTCASQMSMFIFAKSPKTNKEENRITDL